MVSNWIASVVLFIVTQLSRKRLTTQLDMGCNENLSVRR